jgi:hypothetical protein
MRPAALCGFETWREVVRKDLHQKLRDLSQSES